MKKYLKDPYVNVKFMTFKVTLLGEFNHPGTITISNEKATLIEILSF